MKNKPNKTNAVVQHDDTPHPENFEEVLQHLYGAITSLLGDATRIIGKEKPLIILDKRSLTPQQKVRFWCLVALYHQQRGEMNLTLEALSLAEDACPVNDKLFILKLRHRRAQIALDHQLIPHALFGYSYIITAARELLVLPKYRRNAEVEALLGDALVHRAYLAQIAGKNEQAGADLIAAQKLIQSHTHHAHATTSSARQREVVASAIGEVCGAVQHTHSIAESRWQSMFTTLADFFFFRSSPIQTLDSVI